MDSRTPISEKIDCIHFVSIAMKCIFVFHSTLKLRQFHQSAISLVQTNAIEKKLPIGVWYHYTCSSNYHQGPMQTPHIISPPIIPSFSVPLSNNAVTLPRWWSIWRVVNRISTPLGLVTTLGLLQLILIMAIISLVAIKGIARLLSYDRRFIRRRRAAIIGVIVVIAWVLLSWRLVSPSSNTTIWDPTCSVHWSHAATATTAVAVAPVRYVSRLWM